ncbi:hypothetical protein NFI96_015629 [Prochilodus magdalenae]|nr:hypothetical protein NFI96_015629 [Prochilodus magdalenae]
MAESSGRYQQLTNEEEPEEGAQVANDAPPPYSSIASDNAAYFDYKDDAAFPKPPSYNVATSLPSYDEAERSKAEAAVPLVAGRDEDFVARDDFEDADQLRIGNDGIFMLTFFINLAVSIYTRLERSDISCNFVAFLFNWIGFFLSFCLTTSAAGRYGAISGFGLSLIKWILIVRFSTYFPGYFDGQYWLWWVFLVLGSKYDRKGTLAHHQLQDEFITEEGKQETSFARCPKPLVVSSQTNPAELRSRQDDSRKHIIPAVVGKPHISAIREVWRPGEEAMAVRWRAGTRAGECNEGAIWEPSGRCLQGFLSRTSPSGGTQVLEAEQGSKAVEELVQTFSNVCELVIQRGPPQDRHRAEQNPKQEHGNGLLLFVAFEDGQYRDFGGSTQVLEKVLPASARD